MLRLPSAAIIPYLPAKAAETEALLSNVEAELELATGLYSIHEQLQPIISRP